MPGFGERNRDLSKVLDPKELAKIRALIGERPDLSGQPTDEPADYPRALYHPTYYALQQEWKANPDPKEKKTLSEKMAHAIQQVFDLEEEEQFLEDGWKRSPADFLSTKDDPRIPRGREARRAAAMQQTSVADEIAALTRRLAELTAQIGTAAPDAAAPPMKAARARRPAPRRRPVTEAVDAAAAE